MTNKEIQVTLPCKIGELLFCVFAKDIETYQDKQYQTYRIDPCRVASFEYFSCDNIIINVGSVNDTKNTYSVRLNDTAFFDYLEAEQRFGELSRQSKENATVKENNNG